VKLTSKLRVCSIDLQSAWISGSVISSQRVSQLHRVLIGFSSLNETCV
jgi:hypothetical protein